MFFYVLAICLSILVGWILYHDAKTIHATLELRWIIGAYSIAGLLILTPLGFALVCDFYCETVRTRIGISELRLDNVVATHEAIREYLGESLPAYKRHLDEFGLAEEIYQIVQPMSEQYDRTYASVQSALALLNEKGGLAAIKHETLKAEALYTLISSVLEILWQHEEVTEASQVDEKLKCVVAKLEEELLAAE